MAVAERRRHPLRQKIPERDDLMEALVELSDEGPTTLAVPARKKTRRRSDVEEEIVFGN